jgi:hypothetical protein
VVKKKMKNNKLLSILMLTSLLTLAIPFVYAAPSDNAQGKPGHLNDGTFVYVTSQGKYYRTIVPPTGDGTLPAKGPFQLLYVVDGQLTTEFGPGDKGYVGGRWMLELPDGSWKYFLCPLLGPAYDEIPQ